MSHRLLLLSALASSFACRAAVDVDVPDEGGSCLAEVARSVGDEPLVYDLAWSPTEADLLLTGSTQLLRAYELRDGELHLVGEDRSEARFNSVSFAPDGRRVFAPTGRELRVYDVEAGADELSPSHTLTLTGPDDELQRGHVTADGARMLLCDTAGVLHLVDVSGPQPVALDALDVHRRCTRVHTAPDAPLVISAAHDGRVALTSFAGDRLERLDAVDMGGESGEARFGATSAVAWAGAFDPPFALWELAVDAEAGTLAVRAEHSGHLSGIGAIDLDTTGTRLITGDHDHTVHVYETDDEGALTLLDLLPVDGHGVHSARTSADARHLARTASNLDELVVYSWDACTQ